MPESAMTEGLESVQRDRYVFCYRGSSRKVNKVGEAKNNLILAEMAERAEGECSPQNPCSDCQWADRREMENRTLITDRARNLAALTRQTNLNAPPPWERGQ